ncbi:putative glycosyl transferase family 2 protein [Selenomonas ruminantium subsp. lactilytica TAM6421]|uniref:Putative glycosyl transferase family 2 protein n=1 Tax=Selenomonas ruminantium subsp. lactilytica (strain NBRC 103574 / TAM6421) TaxID=927704 RepID=I0GTS6_SELRL|nr:glycosyltransferase family 2 protein [Selenomonas ruminantium]BAL84163.1 putative glycosyl transferase family 2 protein [Selenomonas ruminantium subsp. lactilytica TAM6421]
MPYISACVIVRNEEKNLPRWLACMSELADEMVVVDTGSTDNTMEIAEQAGARLFSFPWINDFAAAKNYALEQAKGDWIIFLDADEYIKPQDHACVRELIRQNDQRKDILGFVNPLINVDQDKDNAYISTIYQIRVFRNLSDLRYVGAIHEILQYRGQAEKNMPLLEYYAIYHTGYSARLMPDKYQRNLQMLELSVKKYGWRLLDDFYFADCYYGLQQYERAIKHAKSYLTAKERVLGEESRPYGILLQSMIFLSYPLSEILAWGQKALEEFPYGAEFKILEGYAREATGDEQGALRCFDEADRLYSEAGKNGAGKMLSDEAGGVMSAMHARREALQKRMQQRKQERQTGGVKDMVYTSACVIVRNEEKNLPRWLACMSELADEMVVVDTGSTDNTVELAKQAGARLFSFPWINDFAAAKNYALEQARGQWIFFLDADEYWTEKDFAIIHKNLRQYDQQKNVIGFVCRLVNIDVDNDNRILNENMHIRIFRNLSQLRYTGAIHEQLVYSGTGQKEMKLLPKAVIYHTGYSASTDLYKAKRNLQILLELQENGKGQESDICYITDCYYSLKDYAKAAEAAQEAIRRQVVLPGRETRMYCTLIQSLHLLGHKWQEILPWVEQGERDFPHVPDFRALLGFAAWHDGAKTEARQFFQQSKALYQEFLAHRQDVTAAFADEMQGFLPKMEAYLAEDNNSSAIKISAAVIVKNEEENLPQWLSCMQALAGEIIVVDTGSTDNTVAIARQAGARVVHFEWVDDFAAAKNFAINQTNGDWVLLLDADEYIPKEDYGGLQAAIARVHADSNVIGLASEWINVDKTKNNAYINKGYQIRVFRKMPELRYVHMIHERLQYNGNEKKSMPVTNDFRIYHTGYSTGQMAAKYKRNLRLLQLSAEKYGKRPEDEAYMADCYFGMQEYEQAMAHAQAYLESTGRTDGAENRPYGVWIQSLIFLQRPLEEIAAVVNKALTEFPYSAEFKIMEGGTREDKGDFSGAEICYREAARLYAYAKQHDIWRQNLLSDEAGTVMPEVYARLCRLLMWQGNGEEAWEYLQKSLAMDKYIPLACRLLGRFLAERDDVDWIEVFNQLYDKQRDAAFILEHLPHTGRDKVRLYYQRQLGMSEQSAYIMAGRLEAAGAALAEDTAALLQLGIRGFAHDVGTMDKIGVLLSQNYRMVATGQAKTAAERSLARKTARIQGWLAKQDGLAE